MPKPFDPLLIPEPKDDVTDEPMRVCELTRRIRNVLESRFGRVAVIGEISNLSRPASRHIYFSLKDNLATINCVMWRSKAARVTAVLTDGLEVVVHGRLTVYEPQGRYQIAVDSIKPKGLGALEVAFRKLKEKLAAEGLFDTEHKVPLPRFPTRIGIVTSLTGAAVRDIINVLGRRWPRAEIIVAPARVQGDAAAGEIAQGVADLNSLGGIDVMIVGRGGGSLEDLWPFNEEVVARAIYASGVPVVSAVGHETDFSISDFVADVRAPTPSVAAELVVPDAGEILRRIGAAQAALVNYITAQVDRAAGRLALVMQERYFRYPLELVTSRAQTIDDISDRMAATTGALVSGACLEVERLTARLAELAPRVQYERRVAALAMARHRLGAATATSTLARRRERVFHLADRLDDLGPMKVLRRGYSITKILRHGVEGRALVRAGDVRPGDNIRTRLAEGEIDSRVAGAEEQTFFDE